MKIISVTVCCLFKVLKLKIKYFHCRLQKQTFQYSHVFLPSSFSELRFFFCIIFLWSISDQRLSGKSTLLDHQSEGFTSTKSYGLKCSTSVLIAEGLIVNCRYCWELSMHWTLEKAPSLKLKCSCLFQCCKWVNLTKKPPLRLHERLKTTSFQCFVLQ